MVVTVKLDCKVTPAGWACQEGNTTGCISSNDGLDAGLGVGFPHRFPTPVQGMKVEEARARRSEFETERERRQWERG
jgi:hypothetical protein